MSADASSTSERAAAFLAEVRRTAIMSGDVRREMADALTVVLDLHKPGLPGNPQYPNLRFCDRCNQAWPCYEFEQVAEALLGGEQGR